MAFAVLAVWFGLQLLWSVRSLAFLVFLATLFGLAVGSGVDALSRYRIRAGIASAVEEQGAATQEIARNVQQAAAGTTEVSANIAGVTRAATDTGENALKVLQTAESLLKQADDLRGNVGGFLENVRKG